MPAYIGQGFANNPCNLTACRRSKIDAGDITDELRPDAGVLAIARDAYKIFFEMRSRAPVTTMLSVYDPIRTSYQTMRWIARRFGKSQWVEV